MDWLSTCNPYSVSISGGQLRFWDPPHDEPDWPWADFADVIAFANVVEPYAGQMMSGWRENWPDKFSDLPDGTMIVPDCCARGMVQYLQHGGYPGADITGAAYCGVANDLMVRFECAPAARRMARLPPESHAAERGGDTWVHGVELTAS